jgi:ribonuclease HI
MQMLPNHLTLYFDGACEPVNPGGLAAFGWRLVDEDDHDVASDFGEVCRGLGATNNVAEWCALAQGLRFLAGHAWRGELEIRGDSQLVIKQLNREWACNAERLKPYLDECSAMLSEMRWTAKWVGKAENTEADELSRKVYPGYLKKLRTICPYLPDGWMRNLTGMR